MQLTRKILKLSLLIFFSLVAGYILYLSSIQDYDQFSPLRNSGNSHEEKAEESEDYMDFINKPAIDLSEPY